MVVFVVFLFSENMFSSLSRSLYLEDFFGKKSLHDIHGRSSSFLKSLKELLRPEGLERSKRWKASIQK